MAVTNRQISEILRLAAKLLELHGDNQFKVKSYDRAAQHIRSMEHPLAEMSEAELERVENVGKTLSKKIIQVIEQGTFEELDRMMELTPGGLVELLNIKGLGGKKVRAVWQELDVSSPEDLLKACKEDRVSKLRGFSKKTQDNIQQTIEYYFQSKDKFLYAVAEFYADRLKEDILRLHPVEKIEYTGEMRRKLPIIGKIEFLVDLKGHADFEQKLVEAKLLRREGEMLRNAEGLNIPVYFYAADDDNWNEQLMLTTGNEQHLAQLDKSTFKAGTEEEIYKKNKLPYIIPEMREGRDEFERAKELEVDKIVTYADLKGCLHNHSTWSDGSNRLETMANMCLEYGLEYFGISDHSKSAFYANGLQEKRVLAQMEEIDELNEKLDIHIFKGIESDILHSGDLDYDDEILKLFDYVVASVHSNLQMNEQVATQRLLKAIENPYTTILGHMTGRLLLMRRGYPVDYKKIIDACAANGVSIEINSNPRRLDMDWTWISYALEKGIMLSLNPDAHSTGEIENMQFGVYMARKGGATCDCILNCMGLNEVKNYFKNKKTA